MNLGRFLETHGVLGLWQILTLFSVVKMSCSIWKILVCSRGWCKVETLQIWICQREIVGCISTSAKGQWDYQNPQGRGFLEEDGNHPSEEGFFSQQSSSIPLAKGVTLIISFGSLLSSLCLPFASVSTERGPSSSKPKKYIILLWFNQWITIMIKKHYRRNYYR